MSYEGNKYTLIAILVSLSIILFSISLANQSNEPNRENDIQGISSNVTIEDNIQTIRVVSRMGGYTPEIIFAQADIPTTLIMDSQNSYGCERAFRIPSLNISEILPTDGEVPFDLGSPKDDILGTCSMGMYTFMIKFL